MRFAVVAPLALAATFALGSVLAERASIAVEEAWARATPPGTSMGAGYLVVQNRGADDRLLGAESPRASRVELHGSSREGGVMKMWKVEDGLPIVRGGRLRLEPGGTHLMFFGLEAPLTAGEKVPVTLRFQKAGPVQVFLEVFPVGSNGPGAKGKKP